MRPRVSRPLGFWDLALQGVAMTLSIRWIAAAAAAGPASVGLWALAMAGFMAPLVIATAELTTRFAGDGGIYAWTRDSLGPFAGFLCAWLYWTCNLPFFSGLLYFIVGALAAAGGPAVAKAAQEPAIFVALAAGLASAVAALHLLGLGAGKWLANFGAAATFALLALLVVVAVALIARGSAAPAPTVRGVALPFNANGAALWATMVFAFGGPEALALLRGEVRGGTGGVLRVLTVVGVLLAGAYIAGTLAMLTILRPEEVSRLSGVPDALTASLGRLGLAPLAPAALVLLALAMLGGYSAWFAVAARLPVVVGVEHYLPPVFARRNARTGAPVAAILTQTAAVFGLIALGQAGATVKAAYDFLVSMSVLSYTLPFVLLFIVYVKVQTRPAPADGWAPPGGVRTARGVGVIGLIVTLSAIACTLVPSPEAADKTAALAKLLLASASLMVVGIALWGFARRRAARTGP